MSNIRHHKLYKNTMFILNDYDNLFFFAYPARRPIDSFQVTGDRTSENEGDYHVLSRLLPFSVVVVFHH
ncbi:hypothetical protein LV84_03025 [Algoriphagus ratkowskyi]|uniref:Uncharacterized protein n=1 Tax=Algoriphagus ratkowskyi TaxID=57028 RepID=A0A2W7RE70_9BACT|nr:hypothetical protein [Algoriphagus ratkowskyi]PZX53917.1 hypothetical protein LV84_03025 [Algoriphagus ratkowskyi]TXD76682.1 hypothetical protein ESW18_15065 [Algoriphagus ratkowskyi]